MVIDWGLLLGQGLGASRVPFFKCRAFAFMLSF